MKFQFFTIPIIDPAPTTAELNAFLATVRVVQVKRQFVPDGNNSAWSICITYLEIGGRPSPDKRSQTDYREVLPEAQFRVFAKLRTLRKELAEKEGIPAYAVFTNEQLAEMVRNPVKSLTSLRKISGIGQSRAEKYGEAFLTVLRENLDATPSNPPGAANGEASEDQS